MSQALASYSDGQLTLDTGAVRRRYRVAQGGHLYSIDMRDLIRGTVWDFSPDHPSPDLLLPEGIPAADRHESAGPVDPAAPVPDPVIERWPGDSVTPPHLRVVCESSVGPVRLRRVFRLYDGCPAIACDLYLRGPAGAGSWLGRADDDAAQPNVESLNAAFTPFRAPMIERFDLRDRHIELSAVRFFEVSDRRNNLVQRWDVMPYRQPLYLQGNLLLGRRTFEDAGFFLLKEAPTCESQLSYPGCDFVADRQRLGVAGLGMNAADLRPDQWVRCYGFVTGLAGGEEFAILRALRDYARRVRLLVPERDLQTLLNTWGDRSQDRKINAHYARIELDGTARLGLSHFMLDDGWQLGKSTNSAFAGGSLSRIWDRPDYWTPCPRRFPEGLAPLARHGRDIGVHLSLWYAPSKDDSYANWKRDADHLLHLHRTLGVCLFKIDMVDIADKTCETHLRRLFEKVLAGSGGKVSFNFDVTAGRRYGYFWFREFGNTFVENRYTDWKNHYPHWTLRNFWQLSRYVPPQYLQVEFLNPRRNADKYDADDPLAPARYRLAYCFALTLMAQPLAWFEADHFQPEQFHELAPHVRAYRAHQQAIHHGDIFPIGEEPDGTSWTGFQSIDRDRPNTGYLIVLREVNDRPRAEILLRDVSAAPLRLEHITGDGADGTIEPAADGRASFSLPGPRSFALYRYSPAS